MHHEVDFSPPGDLTFDEACYYAKMLIEGRTIGDLVANHGVKSYPARRLMWLVEQISICVAQETSTVKEYCNDEVRYREKYRDRLLTRLETERVFRASKNKALVVRVNEPVLQRSIGMMATVGILGFLLGLISD
jgi:hypothetical protein